MKLDQETILEIIFDNLVWCRSCKRVFSSNSEDMRVEKRGYCPFCGGFLFWLTSYLLPDHYNQDYEGDANVSKRKD